MNNEQNQLNFESLVNEAINADTDDFFELARIFDLNPLTDFAGADLHETNLRGKNLQGANFKRTNFSSANLGNTDLRGANLSYSDLSGADLRNADLRDASLNFARVENAQFANNKGVYERLKLDLIERGAIFEEITLDIKGGILKDVTLDTDREVDINLEAYEEFTQSQETLEKYRGQYVAFYRGQFIDSDPDEKTLLKRLNKNYPEQSCLVELLVEKSPIIDMPLYDIV